MRFGAFHILENDYCDRLCGYYDGVSIRLEAKAKTGQSN